MKTMRALRFTSAMAAALGLALGVLSNTASGFTPSGANALVSGAGYTLANPALPNSATNQALLEFAFRLSQTDGTVTGKSLTIRGYGSPSSALDGFSGTKYVARSWVQSTTVYAGIPPYPGNGAVVPRCSLVTSSDQATFGGRAAVYLVDPSGIEHATALSFDYQLSVKDSLSTSPDRNGVMLAATAVYLDGAPSSQALPFTLPGSPTSFRTILAGATTVKDGPAPAAGTCPDTVAPSAPAGFSGIADATGITLSWTGKDNVGVTGYDVYLDGSKVSTQAGASYRFGPLTGGRSYTFAVGAFDAAGNVSALGSVAYTFQTPSANGTVSGAGYTLVNPPAGTTVSNQALFEFAFRLSQVDGSVTGKMLTLRSYGSNVTALDGYTGNIFVARSWLLSPPSGPATPPFPGNSAIVPRCGLAASGDVGSFTGRAAISLVDAGGIEHPTSLSFDYAFAVKDYLSPSADRNGVRVSATRVYDNGLVVPQALPFPLPGSASAFKTVLGGTAVVKPGPVPPPSACPDTSPPAIPGGLAVTPDASGLTLAWGLPADNVAVAGFDLYLDGVKVRTQTGGAARAYRFGGLVQGSFHSLGVDAVDFAGNTSGLGSVLVQVPDITPPALSGIPQDRLLEATSAAGAVATFPLPTAADNVDSVPPVVTCAPPSGSTFDLGPVTEPLGHTTIVTCSATDHAGNTGTATFKVTVRDTTPPLIGGMPTDKVLEAVGPDGTSFTYTRPTALDAVDGTVTVVCTPSPGSTFPLVPPAGPPPGVTAVVCSATDARANTSTRTFTVTVRDTAPPLIAGMPGDRLIEATGPAGATVTYPQPTGFDAVDGSVPVTCLPPTGSTFPIGSTVVICTATDVRGNSSSRSFTVIVRDTSGPVLPPLPNIVAEATGPTGAVVAWPALIASDLVDGPRPVECTPDSGTTFGITTTPVTCTSSDTRGNSSGASFVVQVRDTTPPTAPCVSYSGGDTGSLYITWGCSTDTVGIAGYRIYINDVLVGNQGNTNFGFGGLSCGTQYKLQVEAYDARGNTSSRGGIFASTAFCTARVEAYANFGAPNAGRAMCRGNPARPESMPGGTASQTFSVPAGVAAIDEVLVQIDPDSRVTGHGALFVNGVLRATADAVAVGDTTFSFPRIGVSQNDQVRFSVTFTATFGKIITVYTAGSPGGLFTAQNSCPDGAPNVSTTATGLRAIVRGWNR